MSGQDVNLPAGEGQTFSAYLARPARLPAPGIVLLQEIFGINDFIRDVADQLAGSGFVVIAPDLFWRQQPRVQLDPAREADRNRAMELFKNMDERLAVQDSSIALDFLRASTSCTGEVAALGYCLGGKLAYLMATRTRVDAAVGYYGVGISAALDEASKLSSALLLHVAGADHLCPPPAQKQIVERLSAVRNAEVHVYEGVGHAFARHGSTSYDAAAAGLADARTMAFLNKHLGKK